MTMSGARGLGVVRGWKVRRCGRARGDDSWNTASFPWYLLSLHAYIYFTRMHQVRPCTRNLSTLSVSTPFFQPSSTSHGNAHIFHLRICEAFAVHRAWFQATRGNEGEDCSVRISKCKGCLLRFEYRCIRASSQNFPHPHDSESTCTNQYSLYMATPAYLPWHWYV